MMLACGTGVGMALTGTADGTMPADAEEGFRLYATVAYRSLGQVAAMLGKPEGTVRSWASRYRWADRVQRQDVSERDGRVASAYADMGRLLPRALAVLGDALDGQASGDQVRAATAVLDRFGLGPSTRAAIDLTTGAKDAPAPVSDAELDRLVKAGDVATLLALATGRPVPERERDDDGDDDGAAFVA